MEKVNSFIKLFNNNSVGGVSVSVSAVSKFKFLIKRYASKFTDITDISLTHENITFKLKNIYSVSKKLSIYLTYILHHIWCVFVGVHHVRAYERALIIKNVELRIKNWWIRQSLIILKLEGKRESSLSNILNS